MAEVKVAAKPVAKAVAAAKPVEAAPAKAEAKATTAKAEAKTATKATAAKKAAPAKKAPVKKETATAEKKAPVKKAATEKKAEVKAVVNLQFSGKSYTTEDLVKIAKDVWKYDLKKKVSDFKTVELYVKPEESQVYYVINEEVTGSFAI